MSRIIYAVLSIVVCIPFLHASNTEESFTVTTHNVEVKELTSSSITLKSDHDSYTIKLEPNKRGSVLFAISGIGYLSTYRYTDLEFEIKVTGFGEEGRVLPLFSLDDVNHDINVQGNKLRFERIHGSIPVWFNEQVDSIHLEYSNSLAVNIDQILRIQDLKILRPAQMVENPDLRLCSDHNVMLAIDGSSSINKTERKSIGRQVKAFVKALEDSTDFHKLYVVEFGTEIKASIASEARKSAAKAVTKYKKNKHQKSKLTGWTNWSVAFDEAIARQPDLLIFITDGWSNWSDGGPSSFSAVYHDLIDKCNTLKANGTRLLFITSDINLHNNAYTMLSHFLNGEQTIEKLGASLAEDTSLQDVDLITMDEFIGIDRLDLTSLVKCPIEMNEAVLAALVMNWDFLL